MQITLEPHLQQLARNRARRKGISLSEYVRRLIREDVGEVAAQADVATIFGIGDSGGTHVGRDKHKLIGEAVASLKIDRRRKP
jgi:hypothetical protein